MTTTTTHPGWSARVEFEVILGAVRSLDELIDALQADTASAGDGFISLTFTIDAPTLDEAHARLLELLDAQPIGRMARALLTRVELVRFDVLDAELARPLVPALVGISETAELLGVTRQRAHAIAQTPSFPPPIAELASGPVYLESAVREFAARPRKAGRPRASA